VRWLFRKYVKGLSLDHTAINQPLKSLLHDFERLYEPIEGENHALAKVRFRVVVRWPVKMSQAIERESISLLGAALSLQGFRV
jgi:hypothetical protein